MIKGNNPFSFSGKNLHDLDYNRQYTNYQHLIERADPNSPVYVKDIISKPKRVEKSPVPKVVLKPEIKSPDPIPLMKR
jgi:hypothetical protein